MNQKAILEGCFTIGAITVFVTKYIKLAGISIPAIIIIQQNILENIPMLTVMIN